MDGPGTGDPNDPTQQTRETPTQFFAPNRVNIIPLTTFVKSKNSAELDYIRVYVELLDDYSSQTKSTGVFQFELSNKALRSVNRIGRRIEMWDKDVTKLEENNKYWREFLRAYEFRLEMRHILQGYFILEVTFFTPDGKRITSHKDIYLGTKL